MKTITFLVLLKTAFITSSFQSPSPVSWSAKQLSSSQERTRTVLHAKPLAAAAAKRSGGSLVLAGRLASTLSKLVIGPAKAKSVLAAVNDAMQLGDLALIGVLGWGSVPLAHLIFKKRHPELDDNRFFKTKAFKGVDAFSQIAKIGGVVYAADILSVALKKMGFNVPLDMSSAIAKISYFAWGAYRVARVKQKLLLRAVRVKTPDQLGKNRIYDRIANVLLASATLMWVLDVLSFETGRAVGSIFALGSVGTLVLSLASKDVASQLVGGLALTASRRFHEGEEIELGDGIRGSVSKMGWMYTDVRGGDEILIKIPNSQIANQRIKNISRIRRSQVKLDLWIKYEDISKIPKLIVDIKEEVAASCPRLNRESRPFRVHWREYASDHLTVTVDAKFNLPPTGDVYWDNRQEVLLAIARAAERNDVNFALPTVHVRSGQSVDDALKNYQLPSSSGDTTVYPTYDGVTT